MKGPPPGTVACPPTGRTATASNGSANGFRARRLSGTGDEEVAPTEGVPAYLRPV
jgi:hypothetical protein